MKLELSANQEARNRFYQAIAAEPNLVEAYLQLAGLYMRWRDDFAKDWPDRAESLLKRAAELSPTCVETKIALAELYALPPVGRVGEAIAILRHLPSPHRGQLTLANLVIDQDFGEARFLDALTHLTEHVRASWSFSSEAAQCLNKLLPQCECPSVDRNRLYDSLRDLLGRIHADARVPEPDKSRIQYVLHAWTVEVATLSAKAGA